MTGPPPRRGKNRPAGAWHRRTSLPATAIVQTATQTEPVFCVSRVMPSHLLLPRALQSSCLSAQTGYESLYRLVTEVGGDVGAKRRLSRDAFPMSWSLSYGRPACPCTGRTC